MAERSGRVPAWLWGIGAAIAGLWMMAGLYALVTIALLREALSGWPVNSDGNFDIDGVVISPTGAEEIRFWAIVTLTFAIGVVLPLTLLRVAYRRAISAAPKDGH